MAIVVFDLDGTLLDTAPDISAACNAFLQSEGYEPLGFDEICSYIGRGVPHLMGSLIRSQGVDLDEAEHARLLATFEVYHRETTGHTTMYPGVTDAMTALNAAGYRLGICTNRPLVSARSVLERFSILKMFDVVIGGDSLPVRKPDPRHLLAVCEELGGGRAIYVGDSEYDADTAERANVPFVLFSKGYCHRHRDELVKAAEFENHSDLPGIIEQTFATGRQ